MKEDPLAAVCPAALAGAGDFGNRVVSLLARAPGRTSYPIAELGSALAARPPVLVAALGQPAPEVCEQADQWAFTHGTCWLPVIMDHPHVRVGPLVAPGLGACFGCFQERAAQHESDPKAASALRAARGTGETPAPRGYLGHHTRLAAAIADLVLADSPERAAGLVATFHVLGTGVRRHRVTPFGGCPRCGTALPRPSHLSLADLIASRPARRDLVGAAMAHGGE